MAKMKENELEEDSRSHLKGYPWPPDEKYFGVWDNFFRMPEEQIKNFVADYAEINRLFYDSIAEWSPLAIWDSVPGYKKEYGQEPPSVALKAQKDGVNKPTVIVCPGGGFLWKAHYEGITVAKKFYELGFNAAVLNYRTMPYHIDDSFADGKRAVRFLRAKAAELGLAPDKIAIMGFSAGAAVASYTGAAFDSGNSESPDPVERVSSRPNAVISCYGAVSWTAFPGQGLSHDRTRQRYYAIRSPDALVSANTPPFFIWQCSDMDDPRFSLNLANRLAVYGVPFEMHIFPDGVHGTALSDGNCPTYGAKDPHIAHWVELCAQWLAIELEERKAEKLLKAAFGKATSSHLPGYPWPPEEKYWTSRDKYGRFPENKIEEFSKDFNEIRKVFADSIAKWDTYKLWDRTPNYEERYGHPEPSIAVKTHNDTQCGLIIVCPGGANLWKASYEGLPVAEWFYNQGFNAAVLDYRVAPYMPDDACADARRAVRFLRANKEKLGIKSDKIAMLGFFAGGMLANMTGAYFTLGDSGSVDPVERESSRLDAAVVCYGAFTKNAFPVDGLISHDRELQAYYSTRSGDALITKDAPPYFIWQNNDMDDPRQAINLSSELTKHGVPFEMHLFPYGVHGTALSDGGSPSEDSGNKHTGMWPMLCAEWLQKLGFK
jgi:acetyl esterase/lipase